MRSVSRAAHALGASPAVACDWILGQAQDDGPSPCRSPRTTPRTASCTSPCRSPRTAPRTSFCTSPCRSPRTASRTSFCTSSYGSSRTTPRMSFCTSSCRSPRTSFWLYARIHPGAVATGLTVHRGTALAVLVRQLCIALHAPRLSLAIARSGFRHKAGMTGGGAPGALATGFTEQRETRSVLVRRLAGATS
jgi:hypothetical protein